MSVPIEPFAPVEIQRDWGTETLIAEGPGYVGKILRYGRGRAGGLQLHRQRIESFHLFSGHAYVDYDPGDGSLTRVAMRPGETFTIPAGAPHRFTAETNCIVFETSNSAAEDRIRLEARYGEPEVGGLPTTVQHDLCATVGCWSEVSPGHVFCEAHVATVPA